MNSTPQNRPIRKKQQPKPTEQQKREDSFNYESSLSFCPISDIEALRLQRYSIRLPNLRSKYHCVAISLRSNITAKQYHCEAISLRSNITRRQANRGILPYGQKGKPYTVGANCVRPFGVSSLLPFPATLCPRRPFPDAPGGASLLTHRQTDKPRAVGRGLAPAETFGEDMESSPTGRKVSRTP